MLFSAKIANLAGNLPITMRKISLPLAMLAVSLGLSACSSLPRQSDPAARELRPADTLLQVSQADLDALAQKETQYRPGEFNAATLEALLTAEIAGQRNQFAVALSNYLEQARTTRDLGIVVRAVRISQYLKAEAELLEMAELWAELDPTAVEPHHLASLALIRNRQYERALSHMEQLLNLEGGTNFDNLAVHAKNLAPEDRQELLRLYQSVVERHPDNVEVLFGFAILQETHQDFPTALATLDRLLQQHPEHQPAIILRGRVLKEVEGTETALAYLRTKSRQYPENRQLGTLYARLLIDNQSMTEAQAEFRKLMERFPSVPGLKLSHALVAIENKQLDLARKELRELLDEGQHTDEAHFYLARIADQQNQVEQALEHYQQVGPSPHYLTALGRSAFLLAKADRLEEAVSSFEHARGELPNQAEQIWQLEINLLMELDELDTALSSINAALADRPQDPQLLYARASVLDKQGDLVGMERDLRAILAQEPDNAVALNALGYILADKTSRHQEARELIAKALALKPDNPAIMDSMGWVEYRLGNIQESLSYLEQAYAQFPDPEVAAHYGEVLWVSGQQEEALRVWLESLSQDPDNNLVQDTMQRLGAKPQEPAQDEPSSNALSPNEPAPHE